MFHLGNGSASGCACPPDGISRPTPRAIAHSRVTIPDGGYVLVAPTRRGISGPAIPAIFFAPVPVYALGSSNYVYDDRAVDYDELRSINLALMSGENGPPEPGEGGGGSGGPPATNSVSITNLWLQVSAATNGRRDITVIITNVPAGEFYDLFRTLDLVGDHVTNSVWRWVARGTNGQSFTFAGVRCRQAFYVIGYSVDTDGDTLTDAFELLTSKTSPMTNHTYSGEWDDREWWLRSNVLVNDPEQDCGNEQNSQFETTIAVVGSNVVVAWVDSNQGVYGLGSDSRLTNYTPRLVGYAVSRDGGVTFDDRGVPPVNSNGFGDAGDPVLAADRANGAVFLVGTSPRQPGQQKGLPFWKSGDGGVNFTNPIVVRDDILQSDKPWIAVDDWPGAGQHDVYLTCLGKTGSISNPTNSIFLIMSQDGLGGSWTNPPVAIRSTDATNVTHVHSPIIQVAPNHTAYFVWFERTGPISAPTNWLKLRTVENRGANFGEVQTVCRLVSTNWLNGDLGLKRSNTAAENDSFRVLPFPVPAINPATNRNGHLYVAYADKGTNLNDKADIFFTSSINAGTNWTAPVRMNTDLTTNDQWMPVLAVKPDGTQLFMAWYDRRGDTNNSLIEFYGRWANIHPNGSVTFGAEFVISTTNFAPVFAGTDPNNQADGHYDPVYPPNQVNLHWWYPEWPAHDSEYINNTADSYIHHVGEYNGAWATDAAVWGVWTDYRLPLSATIYPRRQSDVRLTRLSWPQ